MKVNKVHIRPKLFLNFFVFLSVCLFELISETAWSILTVLTKSIHIYINIYWWSNRVTYIQNTIELRPSFCYLWKLLLMNLSILVSNRFIYSRIRHDLCLHKKNIWPRTTGSIKFQYSFHCELRTRPCHCHWLLRDITCISYEFLLLIEYLIEFPTYHSGECSNDDFYIVIRM